ncbi:metalloregulator ArsR/SmtB family transcription factor [Loktanella sp. SALINAS62]|uniref:ArsR/SmtB family transcription factor n=1 Tax=Loktanella sp. SALINAS62 TaxID=2706124 RepID=UPI001B8C61CD|nr:metalloregulator ArsR/SmtB family transcription factor [Loktanella sp. SALINAS62]MBS1303763.1 winged helix-turn-helix transcriptional regulator [Loktanella sp. SALINAS62]
MTTPPDPVTAAADHLNAMGNPVRLAILCALRDGPLTVGQLQSAAGQAQALISSHLKRLRNAGLVRADRSDDDARIIFYSLSDSRIVTILDALGL